MDNTKELGESRITPLIVRFAVPSIIGMVVGALYMEMASTFPHHFGK